MISGPFVVSFIGPSGVGKTTLIEQVIPHLRTHGLRVGTVKHAPHGHDVVDKPGSDSARHRSAGAEAVLLAGASSTVLFLDPGTHHTEPPARHHSPADDRQRLSRLGQLVGTHLAHVDVVIAEGYAPICDAHVAVQRAAVPAKPSPEGTRVWFRVSDQPLDGDLRFDQVEEVANRIAERVHANRAHTPVST